jgi:hypothetical protein
MLNLFKAAVSIVSIKQRRTIGDLQMTNWIFFQGIGSANFSGSIRLLCG